MNARSVGIDERRARLGRRHHLAARTESVVEVAGDLMGLHSSDPATVFLSARARVANFEAGMLEQALYEDRTLLRIHGMRRTMFVAPRDLAVVIDASCGRQVAATERKRLFGLLAEHVTDDPGAWFDAASQGVLKSLDQRGEALAADIKSDVPALETVITVPAGSFGIISRVLFQLAVEGAIFRARPRGSWRSSQYRWATAGHWIPDGLPEVEPEAAAVELVGRWLRSYGPATLADVAWWTGWPKGRTNEYLAKTGAVEVALNEGAGYVHPDDTHEVSAPEPWVALLPGLDATTMGWKERDWYLGPHREPLFDRNGNAGPTVWCDGRIVGGWAQRPTGEIALRLLEDVGSEAAARIEDEAHRAERWLTGHVVIPRFRVPLERELST